MSFAQPWLLLGMLAALIPLLVHLFDRRRPRQVPFGALAFVMRSQKRTASRLRLKRVLLYALRTFLFLSVPFALARPSCSSDAAVMRAKGPAATVVVIDTSLAMRFKASGALFDEALKHTKAAIAELQPDEPATVISCGGAAAAPAPLSFEKTKLVNALDELKPSYELADLNRCLELAARTLDESPLLNRRIVIVSAFTESSLRLDVPTPLTTGPKGEKLKPEVVLRTVAEGQLLPNRALVDVKAEPAFQAGPRAWQFTFTVRNFSDEGVTDVPLELKVDGEVVTKGFVDLAAKGTAQKALSYRFTKPGLAVVEGALAPDGLAEDDTLSDMVLVPKELKVLLVNGAPSPQKYKDEAYFVDAALSAPGSPVRPVLRDTEAAWREDLAQYDAVMLLNVEAPSAEVAQRLVQYVNGGGGLFISMGDRVDPEAWNASLGALLPRKLRVVKTAVEPNDPSVAARAAKLNAMDLVHPVLTPFTGRAKEGLFATRFARYVLFEAEGAAAANEVLASLDDGAPVMLAARREKGRVFVFASTVDRDWSDFPIRTSFLPLMQRLSAWLTGSLDERSEVKAHVGEQATLKPPAGTVPASAKSPSGVELAVVMAQAGDTATVGPLPEPGPYRVTDAKGVSVDALAFAASLDSAASDLSRHSPDALRDWFGDDVVRTAGFGSSGERTPVWTWLLIAAALAFFLEGLLLRR